MSIAICYKFQICLSNQIKSCNIDSAPVQYERFQ